MSIAIEVERVGKLYMLGKVGTGTLSHDLKRWWASVRGEEDPFAKVGAENDRTRRAGGNSEYVWALQDIDFKVREGEVVGVIGKNGAGKSTLLKILSRITAPTTGSIKVKGRIGSLLEVGTGFHPEMTGRENVYMNGTILGMRRHEISRKFDDIVQFAGVEKYIDTPVKRYSSGMMVRLGFAVAAFLEPEILIVDEVLAVGDAEFQKKAIGKMQDVSQQHGRTVLFVSHNMAAVSSLCTTGVVIRNGRIGHRDTIENCIHYYLDNIVKNTMVAEWNTADRPGDDSVRLNYARIVSTGGETPRAVTLRSEIAVEFSFEVLRETRRLYPNVHFFTKKNEYLFAGASPTSDREILKKGTYTVQAWLPSQLLNEGGYIVGVAVSSFNPTHVHFFEREALVFDVIEEDVNARESEYIHKMPGFFRPSLNWEIKSSHE